MKKVKALLGEPGAAQRAASAIARFFEK